MQVVRRLSRRSILERLRHRLLWMVAMLYPAVSPVAGQHPVSSPGSDAARQRHASVYGVITDGLKGGPLRSANVLMGSTGRMATTDSLGAYRIDSVAAGVYQFEVLHPLLDTLGITVLTGPISVPSNSKVEVSVTTVAPHKVIEHFCTADDRRKGPGVVVGQVIDIDSGDPSPNVNLRLMSDVESVAGSTGAKLVRDTRTDVSGHYRICGLPAGFTGRITATRNMVTTPSLPISIGPSMIALQSVSIGVAELADSVQAAGEPTSPSNLPLPALLRGKAILTGRVTNSTGIPVNAAVVFVPGTRASAITGLDGTFKLSGLPSGTRFLSVRRHGFADFDIAVELSMRAPVAIDVAMEAAPIPQQLATVSVVAQRNIGLQKLGFTERKLKGSGFFITGDDIVRNNPTRLSDVFRMTPGVRVVAARNGGPSSLRRNDSTVGCINIILDGQIFKSLGAVDIDAIASPGEVAGIEVYNASSTPNAFLAIRSDGLTYCTTVVIWTRYRAETVR